MQESTVTIRTLECDICNRFDTIMLSYEEIKARVDSTSIKIGTYTITHKDHKRIVYFNDYGEYLGDTIAFNDDEIPEIIQQDDIPFYIVTEQKRNIIQRLKNIISKRIYNKSLKITITGPSRAGKTSLVRYLNTLTPERETGYTRSVPTMGKSTKHIKLGSSSLTVFDMGGQIDFRKLWKEPVKTSDFIFFVLDATSNAILEIAEAFEHMISFKPEETPVLVILNKKVLVLRGEANHFSNSGEFISLTQIDRLASNVVAVEASVYEGIAYVESEEIPLAEIITSVLDDYT